LSTPFQNRIVGTVIVAAIAIIFLPDLLDGDKKKYNAEFENIPQAPKIDLNAPVKNFPNEKLKVLEPKPDEVVEVEQDNLLDLTSGINAASEKTDENITSQNDVSQKSTTKNISSANNNVKVNALTKAQPLDKNTTKTNIIDTKKTPASLPEIINVKESWVIQLGSFRHKKNVKELVEKLKYHGYTTFTRPIKTRNGMLTKVFVGPDINKTSLENKIKPLKELTHVNGKVTRFYPAK